MVSQSNATKLESLDFSARNRLAVELGRQSMLNAGIAKEILQWSRSSFTLRLCAVYACHGSRDTPLLLRLAQDASRTIASTACSVLGAVADDDTLVQLLLQLPRHKARRLAMSLRRRRRNAIDRFVTEIAKAKDANAWPLVAICSESVVNSFFEESSEIGGVAFWRRLCVFHPSRATRNLLDQLAKCRRPDGSLIRYAISAITILCRRSPDDAMKLVQELSRHQKIVSYHLHGLVQPRTAFVVEAILSNKLEGSVPLQRVVKSIDPEQIVRLVNMSREYLPQPEGWLSDLAPTVRWDVYRAVGASWGVDGMISPGILKWLPTQHRNSEARWMLDSPTIASQPLSQLGYASLLPWEEAVEKTAKWLTHPEAEYRAPAIAALCESARFSSHHLGELLQLLVARRHEQDPVRLAFWNALAGLPPSRWLTEHLPQLAVIIRQALDAADLSSTTVYHVGRFLTKVLPFHPGWTVNQIALLTTERGEIQWAGAELTSEQVHCMRDALTPTLKSWVEREYEHRILAVARMVGRRLSDWPELTSLLERITARPAHSWNASIAMSLLMAHLPKERNRLVTTAIQQDESWAVQPVIYNYMHARRQDLLTPFLGQRVYAGKFSTGRVYQLLPFESGFHRWTDSQQEIYATSLMKIVTKVKSKSDAQMTWDMIANVKRLAAIPAISGERMIGLARDERPAIQETAVRALGRLDAQQGMSELLEALNDQRARWAVYALRASMRDSTPRRVLQCTREIPLQKVTVAKEAIRLAGEFAGPESLEWFSELHTQAIHRDVRSAMLRALWDHLEDPRAWEILNASALMPDLGIVIGLARIPIDRISKAARLNVAALLTTILDHPEPTVRLAILQRLTSAPVPDPSHRLLNKILDRLVATDPIEQSAAISSLLANAIDDDAERVGDAIGGLLDKPRQLKLAMESLSHSHRFANRLVPVGQAILNTLMKNTQTLRLQIPLAASLYSESDFAEWVLQLAGKEEWHSGVQSASIRELQYWQPAKERLELAEKIWAESTDSHARWMGLQLLQINIERFGWRPELIDRLTRYQNDTEPLVANEAHWIIPPAITENPPA